MAAPRGADPHTAVTHELLVRHLDAWTPAVLHGSRRACYAEGYAQPPADGGEASAVAALRVFGEFGDLLARKPLVMALAGPTAKGIAAVEASLTAVRSELRIPDGLAVRTKVGPVVLLLEEAEALAGPVFAYFDAHRAQPPAEGDVAAVVGGKGGELLLRLDPAEGGAAYRRSLRAALGRAKLTSVCDVDLVDAKGVAQALFFATGSAKNLEKFKDQLWALDEYAGIRYRDPVDDQGALLDISLEPHLGPLRRALLRGLDDGSSRTLADLRAFAVSETIYRAADATRAVSALLHSGALAREPAEGRLVPTTSLRAA
jgi:hypothetical protein